jgi:sugar phosphate isomerase/epimerase
MNATTKYPVLPPLALDYLSVSGAHPVEHIEAAAANGFTAVGLRLAAPLGLTLQHDLVNQPEMLRETLRALKGTGMKVLSADAFTLAEQTKVVEMAGAFDVAAALGSSIIQVVVEDPDIERARDRFAQMCLLAGHSGMSVALEFMKWRSLKSLAEAAAFVTGAGAANGVLCIDTLHLSRCGDTPAAVVALSPERIGYVQLCDAPAELPPLEEYLAEARGGRLYPGDGELWLQDLVALLPADIPLSVEVPRAIDAGRSVAERARQAAEAMHRFFARVAAGRR